MHFLNKNQILLRSLALGSLLSLCSGITSSFAGTIDPTQDTGAMTADLAEARGTSGNTPDNTDDNTNCDGQPGTDAQICGMNALNPDLTDFIRTHRTQWHQEDLNYLFPAPSPQNPQGWKYRPFKSEDPQVNLDVYERKDPGGDPNHLYYYWNDTVIDLPIEVVEKAMAHWIDLSKSWTKELTFTGEIYNQSGDSVWFQLFDPHILGVKKRRLVAVYSSTPLSHDELGVRQILVSCRSIPKDIFTENVDNKDPRIDWHGAIFLSRDPKDPNKTRVRKIDRENQGGLIPAWIVNPRMPKYLREEALGAAQYLNKNRDALLDRYKISGTNPGI